MKSVLLFVLAMLGVVVLATFLPADIATKTYFVVAGVQLTGWLLTVLGGGLVTAGLISKA